ncbi:hypothetical protein PUN28_008030 [Cardiocondyla obscurior]|uniref:Uncharacterized protein n=1 Tax=Cardiocondyla obscurior TaxID=286306 RepID=A0AAW2FW89_9HYME
MSRSVYNPPYRRYRRYWKSSESAGNPPDATETGRDFKSNYARASCFIIFEVGFFARLRIYVANPAISEPSSYDCSGITLLGQISLFRARGMFRVILDLDLRCKQAEGKRTRRREVEISRCSGTSNRITDLLEIENTLMVRCMCKTFQFGKHWREMFCDMFCKPAKSSTSASLPPFSVLSSRNCVEPTCFALM